MRKLLSLALAVILSIAFTACGVADNPAQIQPTEAPAEATATPTEPAKEPVQQASEQPQTAEPAVEATAEPTDEPAAPHAETLVVVFSATGTTKGVAEKIAKVTGADLYEIIPAEPYTDADLNWNDRNSRSTKEQNDKNARPAIGSETIDLTGYTTIFIGFPIWWGEEPRIMDTFAESYDFTGITLIPFCTSGGSGIGRSGPNMEALAKSGTWLNGTRHKANVSEADLQAWISGLK